MGNLPIYIRVKLPEVGEQWATPETPYTECRLLDFRYDGGYGYKCRSTIVVQTSDGTVRSMRELSEHKDDRHKLFEFLEEQRRAEFLYEQTHFKGKSLDEQQAVEGNRRGRPCEVHYNHLLIRFFPHLSCGLSRVYPATPKRIQMLERLAQGLEYKCMSLRESLFLDDDEECEDYEEIVITSEEVIKVKTDTKVITRVWRKDAVDDKCDYDVDYEQHCPHCGYSPIHYRNCQVIGCDDGQIDMHEYDDPLWYDEGEYETCHECNGTGIEMWCPKCGKDPREIQDGKKVTR